ncbi:hypothetical protein C1N87_28420 (plasmid) [Priestia aryabhattai]
MNTTYKQSKKINKKPDIYIMGFILDAIFNSIDFTINNHIYQGLTSLVFAFAVIYFSEGEKVWAIVVIKMMGWLHILMLVSVVILFLTHKI